MRTRHLELTVSLLISTGLLASCGGDTTVTTVTTELAQPTAAGETVRIVLVGDIMTGRGVAGALETDPDDVFADVRHLLGTADIVAGNLESPLTARPHVSANENELEANPDTAIALAKAGFDLLALPNNHSTDAGPLGLLDTIAAVEDAEIRTVGAGADAASARAPQIVAAKGLQVGFLAFDATGVGAVATADQPGVAAWEEGSALQAVADLSEQADIVVVSIHGGTEYLPTTDPGMAEISEALATAGADVIWGHGAHVVQPVAVTNEMVVATSLGNFLFDQSGPDRTTGALLEIMADATGIAAYRVGITDHANRRVEFVEWLEPTGDAAWLDGSWWNLVHTPPLAATTAIPLDNFRHGDLVAGASGNVTGDGISETVASFRRPHKTTPFMETHPEVQWADADGRSAHLGVYEPKGLQEIWVAGSVLMPITDLEVCDGALATIHDSLDDPTPIAAGAWEWNGFGFDTASDIPGGGEPGCADLDGDGMTEPVILNRS
ncbi:MAG: CapA family protein [bacterium]|nr:CapA family protein [bacterium]